MRKVYYEMKFNGEWKECVTMCPVPNMQGNVGSLACHECPFFVEDCYFEAENNGYVVCNSA